MPAPILLHLLDSLLWNFTMAVAMPLLFENISRLRSCNVPQIQIVEICLKDSTVQVALTLLRIVPVVALICSITFLFNALPSNATIPTSSNTQAALDNTTSLNQTLPALVNQSLISLNETATEQSRLIEEAKQNASAVIKELGENATGQQNEIL
jgi:hypothetical protein